MYGRTNISGTSSQRETTCAQTREGEREEEVGELGRKMEYDGVQRRDRVGSQHAINTNT